jgi:hypothetical protein
MNKVLRPEARYKTHQLIQELLDISKEFENPNMRVTQLITYSKERDVLPFSDTLDKIYGVGHKDNYGLFAMQEAFPNVHVGY